MKKIGGILFLSMCAYLLTGCTATQAPASNAAVTNSNAASKPAAAPPTADALLAMDKQAVDAYFKGDASFWPGFLSDKAVDFNGANAVGKDAMIKQIVAEKCEAKSYSVDEPKAVMIDNDDYVLVYRSTADATCTHDGTSMKAPSPTRAATLYTRNGDKWQAVWHNEVPVIDPKNPPAPPAADANKPADKKADDKPAANSNSGSTTGGTPAKSANTDALVKLQEKGWEAFKNKDAKWFDAGITASFVNVGPMGDVFSGKADAIKNWTETMKCDGITKVSVTDAYGVSLSPTLELLHVKGNADGKCDGHPNGDLWQTNLYVKDGDAWKLAFLFESMPTGGM
jgi:ketosteroid isomerase-like protein